jgi:hypothetical protein
MILVFLSLTEFHDGYFGTVNNRKIEKYKDKGIYTCMMFTQSSTKICQLDFKTLTSAIESEDGQINVRSSLRGFLWNHILYSEIFQVFSENVLPDATFTCLCQLSCQVSSCLGEQKFKCRSPMNKLHYGVKF